MSSLLNDMLVSMASKCPVLTAPTDWKETEDSHVFITDLPGLDKDEVAVEVVDGGTVLQISGERKADDGDGKDKWRHLERCRGNFLRRFRLPKNADTDKLKASMENGVLVVTIPKVPVKKPETKRIQID